MKKLVLFSIILITLASCRKNIDRILVTNEEELELQEYFEFTLLNHQFILNDLSVWIEDHDSIVVTQFENFGTSDIPQFIFNIHGTGEGSFEAADFRIALDESLFSPSHFSCKGCQFNSQIKSFDGQGEFVIGTFSGEIESDDGVHPIEGSFAGIREN